MAHEVIGFSLNSGRTMGKVKREAHVEVLQESKPNLEMLSTSHPKGPFYHNDDKDFLRYYSLIGGLSDAFISICYHKFFWNQRPPLQTGS